MSRSCYFIVNFKELERAFWATKGVAAAVGSFQWQQFRSIRNYAKVSSQTYTKEGSGLIGWAANVLGTGASKAMLLGPVFALRVSIHWLYPDAPVVPAH
jgi:hypothetical protein